MPQQCNPQRRVDDAPAPIGEGAFSEGLQLNAWSIIDRIIRGAIYTSKPAVSWLFVPASPKLLAPVTALTAEVWLNFICRLMCVILSFNMYTTHIIFVFDQPLQVLRDVYRD